MSDSSTNSFPDGYIVPTSGTTITVSDSTNGTSNEITVDGSSGVWAETPFPYFSQDPVDWDTTGAALRPEDLDEYAKAMKFWAKNRDNRPPLDRALDIMGVTEYEDLIDCIDEYDVVSGD
jgi:hypothetical protein